MAEKVNHPAHYGGAIECIDAIAVATHDLSGEEAFNTGNAIKYLWRWKKKNGVEDIKKAIWYCNRIIEKSEEETLIDAEMSKIITGEWIPDVLITNGTSVRNLPYAPTDSTSVTNLPYTPTDSTSTKTLPTVDGIIKIVDNERNW